MQFTPKESAELFAELANMKTSEFISALQITVRRERHAIVRTCHFINELERRRCFEELGVRNAFTYLTKKEGYSEGSANSRIQAARYLRVIPEAAEKMTKGELSMEAIATVQRTVREAEKQTGKKVSVETKAILLKKAEGKSNIEIEQAMAAIFPQAAPDREIIQIKNENEVRAHITFTQDQMKKLERIKEILSHKLTDTDLATVIGEIADDFLSRKDPLRKVVKARVPLKSKLARSDAGSGERVAIAPSLENLVRRRDKDECQFPLLDGSKCKSRYKVQIDHILAVASGGTNEPDNLRCLCRHHNFQHAEKTFGKKHMSQFLRSQR